MTTTAGPSPRPRPGSPSTMRWYALAGFLVMGLTLPLGYYWQINHGETPGLRGLSTLAPDVQARVREAVRTGEIALPADVAALGRSRETAPAAAADTPASPFHLITPLGIAVVQDRPVLAWEPFPGADSYVVTIVDDQGRPVGRGIEVRGPVLTVPVALPRGRVYGWQVTAHRGEDRVTEPAASQPPARFKVLDQPAADALLAWIGASRRRTCCSASSICRPASSRRRAGTCRPCRPTIRSRRWRPDCWNVPRRPPLAARGPDRGRPRQNP